MFTTFNLINNIMYIYEYKSVSVVKNSERKIVTIKNIRYSFNDIKVTKKHKYIF